MADVDHDPDFDDEAIGDPQEQMEGAAAEEI